MKEGLRKWMYYSKAVVREFHPDLIAPYTASAAWFIMLSFLPLMIVLISLIRFLPFLQADSISFNADFIPLPFRELLRFFVNEINQNTSSITLPLGALTGLISASTGFSSLIKGLNIIYRRRETRPIWRVRLMCLVYTVLFLCVLIVVLALIIFGKALLQAFEQYITQYADSFLCIAGFRSYTGGLILTLFFTMLYNSIPNRRSKWYNEIPGACTAAGMWILFSRLYSLYITNLDRFSKIYGSLTLIILLMIWLYACLFIVFIGAYVNVLLQEWVHYKREGKKGDRSGGDTRSDLSEV